MNATVTTMERKTIQLVDMRKVNNKLHIMSRTIVHSDQMGNGLYSNNSKLNGLYLYNKLNGLYSISIL